MRSRMLIVVFSLVAATSAAAASPVTVMVDAPTPPLSESASAAALEVATGAGLTPTVMTLDGDASDQALLDRSRASHTLVIAVRVRDIGPGQLALEASAAREAVARSYALADPLSLSRAVQQLVSESMTAMTQLEAQAVEKPPTQLVTVDTQPTRKRKRHKRDKGPGITSKPAFWIGLGSAGLVSGYVGGIIGAKYGENAEYNRNTLRVAWYPVFGPLMAAQKSPDFWRKTVVPWAVAGTSAQVIGIGLLGYGIYKAVRPRDTPTRAPGGVVPVVGGHDDVTYAGIGGVW